MSAAERVYRLLLRAYPAEFRAEYAGEMVVVFRDLRREAGSRGLGFWAGTVWDVARSAPALRLERSRWRWGRTTRNREGEMMTMAILAILIGAMQAVNALQEVWVRGALNQGWPLLGGTLAMTAGALLLAAGAALLRRSPGAVALARAAAVTSVAVYVLVGLVQPQMSYFATLLGIGFPVVLLLFLRRGGELRPRPEPGLA